MYVWNKRLVVGLLVAFILLEILFWATSVGGGGSQLHYGRLIGSP